MTEPYIKNWKLREGYPEDPESVKEIAEIAKKSGNGWWWFKNASGRLRAESTLSDMYKKKKPQGGRMDLKGKRRGF
jgi:hypothetical protein